MKKCTKKDVTEGIAKTQQLLNKWLFDAPWMHVSQNRGWTSADRSEMPPQALFNTE